jgi:hypothetical protein
VPWDESKLAFTVDGVLTAGECETLIKRAEATGFTPSPMAPLQKGFRSRFDDTVTSRNIFERLQGFLPPVWRRCELTGLTPTFRFIRYAPGDEVLPHPDTSGGDRHTPVADPSCSYFTCLLNLIDGYAGCETHLLPDWANQRLDLWPATCGSDGVPVVPGAGRALVFEHDVVHGCPPLVCGVKYQLRLDVCYAPRDLDGRRVANPFRDPALPRDAEQRPPARAVLRALAAAAGKLKKAAPAPTPAAPAGGHGGGLSAEAEEAEAAPAHAPVVVATEVACGVVGKLSPNDEGRGVPTPSCCGGGSGGGGVGVVLASGAPRLRLVDRIRLQQAADERRRSAVRPVIGGAPARDRFAGHIAVVSYVLCCGQYL